MSTEYPNESGPERAMRLWNTIRKPKPLSPTEQAQVWKFNHPGERHPQAQLLINAPDPQNEVVEGIPAHTLPEQITPLATSHNDEASDKSVEQIKTRINKKLAKYYKETGSRHIFNLATLPIIFADVETSLEDERFGLRVIPVLLDDLTRLKRNNLNKFVELFRKFSDRRNRKLPVIKGEMEAAMDMFSLALKHSSLTKEDLKHFEDYYDVEDLAKIWVKQFDAAGWGLLFSTGTPDTNPKERELIEMEKSVHEAYTKFLGVNTKYFNS